MQNERGRGYLLGLSWVVGTFAHQAHLRETSFFTEMTMGQRLTGVLRAMVLSAAVAGVCWTNPASAQLAEGSGGDKKAAAAATQGTSVPVKAVVLFSSGVG